MSTDSPPTSRLRFLDATGAETNGPREWTRSLIEVLVPPDELADVRLLRHGQPLRLIAETVDHQVRVVAEWPLSGTGRYQLVLETPSGSEQLEITVNPEKISPAAYARLVEDLESSLPASIALGLQKAGALTGIHLRPPGETTLAQELARLKRALNGGTTYPGLPTTLAAIARDPHSVLTKREMWVRRERVRRLEAAGLVAAFRRVDNTDLELRLPIQLPDVRVEHTVDVYENRLLRAYHDQVATRLRRLHAAFLAQNSIAAVLEVEQLAETLAQARRAARFLDDVSALRQIPTNVTMVLLKRPEYRSLLEGYLNFRRSAHVELDEPTLETPLENLPKLYEIWGTLQAIQVLLKISTELGYSLRSQRLAHHYDGGIYINILKDGAPALELEHPATNTLVRLTPQRYFTTKSSPLRSISYTQIPDITIEITQDEQRQLLLLDPKYKLQSEEQGESGDGKPKKIDIDTMHAYRDAIRDSDERRVVTYAAILYPGPETRYGDGIEALSARPLTPNNLQQRLGGVLTYSLASR